MSASPVCCGSCLATRSSATPDIRDWTISRLQIYLRSNNIPFKSTSRIQKGPAVTFLATMGIQQAPIVLPSPPTITFRLPLLTAGVQQAPAVTSLATMGVQQAPIVLPSLSNRFSTSCELQQGLTAPFYSLPPWSSKCNLLGYPPLTAGIQQAPAATSLAAMGVQHDPIVVSSL
ncbi:UNVERIFIED_CONTAM: hypothetical protein FKN15_077201 [Acipenser sinensis]